MLLGVLCLLSVCLLAVLQTDGTQNQLNVTLNETQQNSSTVSGLFSVSELAGVRSFPQELQIETRIIGGQEAWAHSWPWQVSLQFSSISACGGAIINPLWVVSAAHCFKRYKKKSLWKVLAGKHDLDKLKEPEEQLVGVSRIISHHRYNTHTKESDLALVKLEQPLVFNEFVRPIGIWMSSLPELMRCTITGWGSTQENGPRVHRLQEVNVSILAFDVCNEYYKGRVRQSMFCAGKDGGGADACQGDSGGPLSCFTGSTHKLAGLVSWGVGCGRAKKPGVYTRIQQHVQWISDIMNDGDKLHEDDITEQGTFLPSRCLKQSYTCSPPDPPLWIASMTEGRCGKLQHSSCDQTPRQAWLSVSPDGTAFLENVTESCAFFWPWMVSLQSNGQHYCSGVLINSRWVLTAKHCSVSPKEDVVVLGVHDLKFMSVQTILVDEVYTPVRDSSFPPKSDLMLVRLSVFARFGPSVSPICVPEEDEELDNSWSCFTAGWGKTVAMKNINPDRLHQAALTLVNQTGCVQKWGGLVTDSHICSHPAGSTSCMGDSGAPLFCRKHDTYFLFGVVTWGGWRCDAQKPAIFTTVSDYQSWITNVTDGID
ncbi:ovochymase-1 isoform X2 [Leuresthes tenuis]|uniref:ovochymase-1 isoform X2 n=1 Tax=Leuresthes tenuis TaxID=355514 RepID=UPI003B502DE8